VPTVRRSRTIAAPPSQVWEVVRDPHHLPRWWPRVERVEAVDEHSFTEVLRSPRGRTVRADFRLVRERDGELVVWAQQVEGTPFARVLRGSETEIRLAGPGSEDLHAAGGLAAEGPGGVDGPPSSPATEVQIELRQTLQGFFPNPIGGLPRLGSWLVRRAAASTIEEALAGLERIVG
jgi:uncharacterized protein YndB with AHSA1/START domain